MPSSSRKRAHHRPLVLQVIRHQQPRRQQIGHLRHPRQVLGLLLDRQREHALGPELDLPGDQRDGFGLLERGLFIGPECRAAAMRTIGGQTAPQPRRAHFVGHSALVYQRRSRIARAQSTATARRRIALPGVGRRAASTRNRKRAATRRRPTRSSRPTSSSILPTPRDDRRQRLVGHRSPARRFPGAAARRGRAAARRRR